MSCNIKDLINATGINLANNSLCFLIDNQLNFDDQNQYIVFPAHTLPNSTVVIPFQFENVKNDSARTTSELFFKVIGLDKLLDVAVAVFDTNLASNNGLEIDTPVIRFLETTNDVDPLSTFYFSNNNNDLKVKTVKATTVENFHFNGPTSLANSFFYPKSVLLQQEVMEGVSGAPVVDCDLNAIGMIVSKVSSGEKALPSAIHCQLLHSAIFRRILPRYLDEVQYAEENPDKPNILNDYDYVADYISKGVPKGFLGFYGQYSSVSLADNLNLPELKQIQDQDGFLIKGFYSSYSLVSNMFSIIQYVKEPIDNNNIRIRTPFNPSTQPATFLYNYMMSSAFTIRAVLLKRIQYRQLQTRNTKTLLLGSSPKANANYTIFMYDADLTLPIEIEYYWYGKANSTTSRSTWNRKIETIAPQNETYRVNASTVLTTTFQFPPFALGNEHPGNSFNMTDEMMPYMSTLLPVLYGAAYALQAQGAQQWVGASNSFFGRQQASIYDQSFQNGRPRTIWEEAQRISNAKKTGSFWN